MWYLYILRCADKSLYTGVTTDITRRVKEHNSGRSGAGCTRGRLPVELVYEESHPDRSSALKRESQIKRWPKEEKEALVTGRRGRGN